MPINRSGSVTAGFECEGCFRSVQILSHPSQGLSSLLIDGKCPKASIWMPNIWAAGHMRFDKVMLDWKVGRDFDWQKSKRGWGKRGYSFRGLLLCSAKRVWPLFKSFLNPPSLSPAQRANTFEAHIILVYRREPIFLEGYSPATQTPRHSVCLVTLVVASLPDWPLVLLSTLICQE